MTTVKGFLTKLASLGETEQIPWTIRLFFTERLNDALGANESDFCVLLATAFEQSIIPQNVHDVLRFVHELTLVGDASEWPDQISRHALLSTGAGQNSLDKLRIIGRNLAYSMIDDGDRFVPQRNPVNFWRTKPVPQANCGVVG